MKIIEEKIAEVLLKYLPNLKRKLLLTEHRRRWDKLKFILTFSNVFIRKIKYLIKNNHWWCDLDFNSFT